MRRKIETLLLAGIIILSIFVPAYAASPFGDLSTNTWCYSYVVDMVNSGFIRGYPDGSFKQESNITRAEVATALSNLNLPAIVTDRQFTDVPSSFWGYSTIHQAYKAGVVLGTNHDTTGTYYSPEQQVTRQDAAIMASRLFGLQHGYLNVSLAKFSDASNISSSAAMHVKNLVKAGILNGYPDGSFRPNQPVTRGEFSRIFSFICKMPKDQLAANVRNSLTVEGIIGAGGNSSPQIAFEVPHNLIYGTNTSITVTMRTTNIPDGSKIALSIDNNGQINIPSSVTVNGDLASFILTCSSQAPMQNYVLKAVYNGNSYTKTINMSKYDNANNTYIKNITVENTLLYNTKSYADIIVETENVPDGAKLTTKIEGNLILIKEVEVKDNKAVYTVQSKTGTPKGTYKFTVSYDGYERTADVIVSDTSSENPYITSAKVSGNLSEGRNDSITITVYTTNIPNGQYISAELYGQNYNSTNTVGKWGISVSDKVSVYNNKATVKIYNSSTTPGGEYELQLSYKGSTTYVNFYVGDGYNNTNSSPYIRYFEMDGTLRTGYNDTVEVTIYTRDIPDGTRLYPEAEGLSVDSYCRVYKNTASFTVSSNSSTPTGYYTITVPYNGYDATTTLRVYNSNNATTNQYITDMYVSNVLQYGETATATVTVLTNNIPNGTVLRPIVENGITAPSSVTVNHNRATFTVTSYSSTAYGDYKITMSYGGYTAKAYVTVDNVTNNSNRYIKSLTVDNSLTCGIEDSSLVTIKTSNMPDGTILYPVVDSGLTVSGSCRVYNNTASFYVYSTKTTGVGSYNVSISYGGTNTSVIVNVVTGKGTLKNISVANSLTYGISSSTAVTVTTMNVPDGTVLYPTINGSLSTTASCQVYNNQATFYVYNFPMTAVGNYTMTISLMGDVSSATVTVATASSNPYIANVSVDNKIVAGTNSYATITLATTNIANGTSLYPSVDNGLSISGLCIVNNNTAVFTIHADSSTVAGSYIVTIPYGNYTTTTTLIIN